MFVFCLQLVCKKNSSCVLAVNCEYPDKKADLLCWSCVSGLRRVNKLSVGRADCPSTRTELEKMLAATRTYRDTWPICSL